MVNGSDLRAWGPEFESGSTFLGGFGLISWDDARHVSIYGALYRFTRRVNGMDLGYIHPWLNICREILKSSRLELELFTLVRRRTRGVKKG